LQAIAASCVIHATKFPWQTVPKMMVHLRWAFAAPRFDVPPQLLARADEVIE